MIQHKLRTNTRRDGSLNQMSQIKGNQYESYEGPVFVSFHLVRASCCNSTSRHRTQIASHESRVSRELCCIDYVTYKHVTTYSSDSLCDLWAYYFSFIVFCSLWLEGDISPGVKWPKREAASIHIHLR